MEISNIEIENAGLVLLKNESAFYDDLSKKEGKRINVIKSFESKNIVACPGSGKTTTLLAKLIVLSNRIPFDDGRGICVFTHTNVAIEKIKEELGSKSDILFSYPNFFGTIQSFINRYLATPSFINKNGFRPIINNTKYYEAIKNGYLKDPSLNNAKTYIDTQASYKRIDPYVYLGNLRFSFNDLSIISSSLLVNSPFVTKTGVSYPVIKKFKEKIYKYGYLPYDEAYSEAREYLDENPKIGLAIQKRFKYVFVDEMQDSGAHQIEILDKLFKDKKDVVFQCFGDANQALYNNGRNEGNWEPKPENSLYINDTKRFGSSIGNVVNTLRVNYHNEKPVLTSSSNNISTSPIIILFDEKRVSEVISKYAEIISNKNLINENGFYAVGRITKPPQNGSFSIKAYYPDYEKNIINVNQKFNNLDSYLNKNTNESIKKRTNSIIDAILYILDEHNIKHSKNSRKFTRKTLLNWIKSEYEDIYLELKINIINWIKEMDSGKDIEFIKKAIVGYFITLINNIWSLSLDVNFAFFNNSIIESFETKTVDPNAKVFSIINDDGIVVDVPVVFNTINGEKGRTHTSTLYLETYKNTYDVEKVLKYMSGEKIKLITRGQNEGKINKTTPITHLKFAYVGMTRCTHLLCVAVRSNIMNESLKSNLISNGWTINEDLI